MKLWAWAILWGIVSCGAPAEAGVGTWTGEIQGHQVKLEWSPAVPRIGDTVVLRTSGRMALYEAGSSTPLQALDAEGGADYLILVRRSGPFRLEGGMSPLWEVALEDDFPDGWVSLDPARILPPLTQGVGLGLLAFLGLGMVFLLVRGRKTPSLPDLEGGDSLLARLEGLKFRLHELTEGDLSGLIGLLDRCWTSKTEVPDLSQAWFYAPGMTWEYLENRYRNKRTQALYGPGAWTWEVWEEEVDTLLFRLRGKGV